MATKKPTKKPATGKAQNRTRGATSAQAIAALLRKDKAVEMKLQGASYAKIAAALGVSRQAAHQLVQSSIIETREHLSENTEQLIVMANMRYDLLTETFFPGAQKGNQEAFEAFMRIDDRKNKLNGLYAPTKSEVTGANGSPLAAGVFAVPFTAPSVGDWTAQAQALAASEEDAAEALLGGMNDVSPPKD